MKRYGLLGRRLEHSYSPEIHRSFGAYSYELFEKEPDEVGPFLKEADFDGINVTVPYKKAVLPYLDRLTDRAEEIGSVNTIVKLPDGRLAGDNTDLYGFAFLLEHTQIPVAGKKALVLGSGGASAAVRKVLTDKGADVFIISRTGENRYSDLGAHTDARLIVNATPVGMYPENFHAPLSLEGFPELAGVIDLIYNPVRTMLLQDAEKRGIPAFNGMLMLAAQAAGSLYAFSGQVVSPEIILRTAEEIEKKKRNIVLVGMPGSGKSVIGRALAARLDREFVDTDEETEKKTNRTPEEIIREDGEEAFRKIETEVLSECAVRSGLVLATGGGAVTRPENYPVLHGNGKIVWIKRELSELDRSGRPLSEEDLEALYRKRRPLYERFADTVVVNQGTPEEAAMQICKEL